GLVRQTKDVNTAMTDTSLAVDIARGRHIDLAAATNIVIKANLGLTGALKRMGIDIKPVHDAVNALTDSHLKYTTAQKDAAKAAATAFKTFADHVGGTKNAVEALGGAMAAWKLAGVFSGLAASAGEGGAAGSVGLLTKRPNLLKAVGPIAIGVTVLLSAKWLS